MSTNVYKQLRQRLRQYRYHWRNRNFKPYVQTINLAGDTFPFKFSDIVAQEWYSEKQRPYQEFEMKFIRNRILKPRMRIIECGPHHGLYTIAMARAIGDEGQVLALEASTTTSQICRQNVELNNLHNVEVKNEAVSDKNGFLSTTGDSNVEIINGFSTSNFVTAIPLDFYYDFKPDFIKIDIEGFEVMALRGMPRLLQTLPALEIEIHTDLLKNYNTSVNQLIDCLAPMSYSYFIQWSDLSEPIPYKLSQDITKRVHLFALP
jgi:FkbM family methyltransferase